MKKFRHGIVISMLALLLSSASINFIQQPVIAATENSSTKVSQTNTNTNFKINASAGIAVDVNTGKILFKQNDQTALPIASLTKLLTLYVVLQQIKAGKLSWNQKVTPTASICSLSQNSELASVPLQTNQQYTVAQLYRASLIYSANDAVMLLAQAAAGSQQKAIDLMRKQAKAWHLQKATIVNTCGLNNKYLGNNRAANSDPNGENMMTAEDVAIVARHLIQDFPEVLKTSQITTAKFDNFQMKNWNLMLPGAQYADKNIKVDGLKTGTSDAAGACFVGTTLLNNHDRLITVVLHANGSNDTGKRFIVTDQLMKYVLNNWQVTTILKAKQSNQHLKTVTVPDGKVEELSVVPKNNVQILLNKEDKNNQVVYKQTNKKLTAPVEKGKVVGDIKVYNNDKLGYLPQCKQNQTQLIAKENDSKANIFVRMWRKIISIF